VARQHHRRQLADPTNQTLKMSAAVTVRVPADGLITSIEKLLC
jgi:hypothetical protein